MGAPGTTHEPPVVDEGPAASPSAFDSIDFCSISYQAREVSESAIIAYWLACQPGCESPLNHHIQCALGSFDKLAGLVDQLRKSRTAPIAEAA